MPNSEESRQRSPKTTLQQTPVKAWTDQPYPAYKDSGVEWLGKVPEHWNLQRIATAADIRFSNVDKHTKDGEHPVRLCNYVDVYHNEKINSDIPFMAGTGKREEIRKFRLAVGDVLVTKDSEDWKDIGVPALVEYAADDLICGYHLAILRPNGESLDGGYLFYALKARNVAWQSQVAAVGVTRYGLSQNAIRSVRIPLPPLPEQHAIAHFLDHANQRIQRHIHAKEKLIKLLEEQKQVIIHQAVTGQIDVRTGQSYPAYKDSGVEWLGKVPEHWNLQRIATAADIRFSNVDKHTKDGEHPVRLCNYVDVYHNEKINSDIPFMAGTAKREEIRKFRLAVGDVLVTKDSEDWLDIGVPALVEYAADDLVCGYHLAILRPNEESLDGGYLSYALKDLHVAWQCQVAAVGVTRYGLSQNAIKSVRIPLPPLPEQHAIAHFLNHANQRISASCAAVKRQINLLHEYRTRLIADVVTGKLDVRKAAAELPGHGPSTTDNTCQDGMALAAQVRSRHP